MGLVGDPLPWRGQNLTTGGQLRIVRPSGYGLTRKNTTGPKVLQKEYKSTLLQWNAERVLTKKLYKEKIDIACIPEIYATNSPYESIRSDREGHKVGVRILIKSSPELNKVNTNNQAEIVGADITVNGDRTLRVFNIYCPPNKDLALEAMEIVTNCLVVGDFTWLRLLRNRRARCRGGGLGEIDTNLGKIFTVRFVCESRR
jgi:hypothetical protein